MSNLLIVDDEIFTVDSIKTQYDWQELGIDQVYTAHSVGQAVRVLEQHRIDVLICDIEMGAHSGLELLEWIQNQRLPVISFVLTGYAEFDYCQRALELGCIGYVLKPARHDELKKVIAIAVSKARKQKEQLSHEGWEKNRSSLTNQFWTEVISNSVASNREAILRKAKRMGVSIAPGDQFLLLLSHWIYSVREPQFQFKRDELRYALNNMAQDIFEDLAGEVPAFISNSNYYVLRQTGDRPEEQLERIVKDCQRMDSYAQEYLNTKLVFCIASFQPPEELFGQFQQIYAFFRRQHRLDGGVLLLSSNDEQDILYYKPEIQTWALLLEMGLTEKLQRRVEEYLDLCAEQEILNVATLYWFWQDFHRMLRGVSRKHGLEEVPINEESWSTLGLSEAKKQAEVILQEISPKLHTDKKLGSVTDIAKAYIEENLLDGNLSRNAIAEYVDVNPEYLSHAFKKQEDISLLEYISNRKIEVACGLLENTELSVSEISARLGYINFSYFSHLFKKKTGFNPAAYRKSGRQ